MEIIKAHYAISKPVKKYSEIKQEADALKKFIDRPNLKGYYNKAYAISHNQVSQTPYAFFVVADDVLVEGLLEHKVVINPEIVKASKTMGDGMTTNLVRYMEMDLSFPFRKPRAVERFYEIEVKYQVRGLIGLKVIKKRLAGVISEIFQHEIEHMQGKNTFLATQKPFKWWELIGTPKSKGETSIGN